MDTGRNVVRNTGIMYGHDQMVSGSYREGFRLESSDIDIMHWSTTHKVICDLSQISLTNPQHTIILMESDDLPPGYTRLELITLDTSISNNILCSLVAENGKLFVSSREYHYNSLYGILSATREPSSFNVTNMDLVGILSWMKWKLTSLIALSQTTGRIKLDHG